MVLKFVVCFAIVAVSLRNVEALSKEDMQLIYQKFLPHITECSDKHGLVEGDLKEAKKDGNLDGIDSCFLACVFKKSGMMNAEGKFDTEKTLENAKEFLKEEEDKKKATKFIEECSSVNSEHVSDDKGCERAKLLVACMAKHKDEFLSL